MKQNPRYTYERFLHEVFERSRWVGADPITYDFMLKRVREAYPKRKFTNAEYLQRKLQYETGGL